MLQCDPGGTLAPLPAPPPADSGSHPTCPVCAGAVAPAEARACERCESPHHRDCWEYCGGCAIFGCRPPQLPTPREPTALADPARVAALGARWAWFFRYQWYGFVAITGGFAGLIVGLPIIGMAAAVLSFLNPLGALAFAVVMACFAFFSLLVVGGAGLWVLSGIGHELTGSQLQRALGQPIALPDRSLRGAIDRIELTGEGAGLRQWVALAPRLVGAGALFLATLVVLVTEAAGGPRQLLPYLLGLLAVTWGFVAYAEATTRMRMRHVESLQNRIAASLKGKG